MTDLVEPVVATRQMNHSEMLYWPGERDLAIRLFEILGCACTEIDAGDMGIYLVVRIEPTDEDIGHNVFYLSEAEPDQLELENELRRQLSDAATTLASARARFQRMVAERPYRAGHLGLRLPSRDALQEVLDRVTTLGPTELDGRAVVAGVLHPSPEREKIGWPVQAFVWTDIVSAGVLAMGQMLELQGAQAG